jgi:ComF family protein
MNFASIFNEFLGLFFPESCVVCGEPLLTAEENICLSCLLQLPRTNNFLEADNAVEKLLAGRFPFERIATFCTFTKGGILQPIIHQVKYNGKAHLGETLGMLFGRDLVGSDFLSPIQLIVPVPLHPKKQKQRGYNQSEMIAYGISKATDIPLSTNNLIRIVHNPTQTKRNKIQRWENVKDIFTVNHPEEFENKHILLVDDIITTGSTIEACAQALLMANGIKISIASIGKTV